MGEFLSLGSIVVFLILLILIFVYIGSTTESTNHQTKKPSIRSNSNDVIKGYKLHVTPDIRTRLKVLKMRGRMFNSISETNSIDYMQHEAIALSETHSWKELGFNIEEAHQEEIWTDIGPIREDRVEDYYQFLEQFRQIIENDVLNPPEKVKRVRSLTDPNKFLKKLNKKYGQHFPKNILLNELLRIDGISESIAVQLFEKGIYDKEGLLELTLQDLKSLKGVGDARANKIIGHLRSTK